jgi:hypothetical protein
MTMHYSSSYLITRTSSSPLKDYLRNHSGAILKWSCFGLTAASSSYISPWGVIISAAILTWSATKKLGPTNSLMCSTMVMLSASFVCSNFTNPNYYTARNSARMAAQIEIYNRKIMSTQTAPYKKRQFFRDAWNGWKPVLDWKPVSKTITVNMELIEPAGNCFSVIEDSEVVKKFCVTVVNSGQHQPARPPGYENAESILLAARK